MQNSEILKRVIRSFLQVVAKKTSQEFTLKSMKFILNEYKSDYVFLNSITVKIDDTYNKIDVDVESTMAIRYSNINKISEFLDIVFEEIFKEIIRSESYYTTDLYKLSEEVVDEIGDLLRELGIKIRWNKLIRGANAAIKGLKADFSFKKLEKKSSLLKPLINSLIDLVYNGLIKTDKKRIDAVFVIVDTIRSIEKKHDLFKFMLLEDLKKEKIDYVIKTQLEIEDVFFFDSSDTYKVHAVSKIDELDNEEYVEAITEFILEIGSFINVKDRPFYINRLKELIDGKCLDRFIELGIDFNKIEETFRERGYNDVIKKTFEALIEIIGSKTSTNYALVVLDTILKKIRETNEGKLLRFITIDRSGKTQGIDAINIDSDINKEDTYDIAKVLKLILKRTQQNQESYAEKASFFKDLEREMGERYYAELDKMGVNVHLLSMRYV